MTINNARKIGGLLLAAGGSSRLGRPKQLVRFRGKTLLRRAAETLIDSECDPVVVVIGAEAEIFAAEISGLPIHVVENENWQTGMSSSIRSGLLKLIELEPDLDAVVITLCDQPNVNAKNIDHLTAAFRQSDSAIIAAQYDGITGVPALFSGCVFDDLLTLTGDKGARELIRSREDVCPIKMEEAALDVDSPKDLRLLQLSTPRARALSEFPA